MSIRNSQTILEWPKDLPKDLPKIAIRTDEEDCINCVHVWLIPAYFEHCAQMYATYEVYEGFSPEHYEKFMELIKAKCRCPFFQPKDPNYRTKVWPENLPRISIATDEHDCVNCRSVWLEPGPQPDFNHCGQMEATRETFDNLSAEQRETLMEIIKTGFPCPFYDPTDLDFFHRIKRFLGPSVGTGVYCYKQSGQLIGSVGRVARKWKKKLKSLMNWLKIFGSLEVK